MESRNLPVDFPDHTASQNSSETEFSTLLQQLAQAHANEVQRLVRRINDLETTKTNGTKITQVDTSFGFNEAQPLELLRTVVNMPLGPRDVRAADMPLAAGESDDIRETVSQGTATDSYNIDLDLMVDEGVPLQTIEGGLGKTDRQPLEDQRINANMAIPPRLGDRPLLSQDTQEILYAGPSRYDLHSAETRSLGSRSESINTQCERVLFAWTILTQRILSGHVFICHPGWSADALDLADSNEYGEELRPRASASDVDPNLVAIQKFALERLEHKFVKENRITHVGKTSLAGRMSIRVSRISHGNNNPKTPAVLKLARSASFTRSTFWEMARNSTNSSGRNLSINRGEACSRFFVMHPASSKRFIWLAICVLLIGSETLFLTMSPFGATLGNWAGPFDMFSATFWTSDILVNFLCGIFVHGKVEMRLRVVAWEYVRTWFGFDLLMAGMQWYTLVNNYAGVASVPAFFIRFFRLIRLLRLGKLASLMTMEEFSIAAFGSVTHHFLQRMVFGSTIANCLIVFLFYIHCSACLWFEVGKGDHGWVSKYNSSLDEGDIIQNYLVSVHWTLSQFQGSIDIYPGNSTSDRGMACLSSCLSIIALATFVSTMTDVLVNLREDTRRRGQEIRLMRGFLNRHIMPTDILARATHYIRTRQKDQLIREKLDEDRLALQLYPPHLRSHLHTEMLAQHLCNIPIFAYLRKYNYKIFAQICTTATSLQLFDAEEDMYASADLAKHTYTVVTGELVFSACSALFHLTSLLLPGDLDLVTTHDSQLHKALSGRTTRTETDSDDVHHVMTRGMNLRRRTVKRLIQGEFVSEAAVWMSYSHEGDLSCAKNSQCLIMNTSDVIRIVGRQAIAHAILTDYARRFVQATANLKRGGDSRTFIDLVDTKAVLLYEANNPVRGTQSSDIGVENGFSRIWSEGAVSDVYSQKKTSSARSGTSERSSNGATNRLIRQPSEQSGKPLSTDSPMSSAVTSAVGRSTGKSSGLSQGMSVRFSDTPSFIGNSSLGRQDSDDLRDV